MSPRIYRLCGRCGADIEPSTDVDRLCRDCWECSRPLSRDKLRQVEAEERAELEREKKRRWIDANPDRWRDYHRKWNRGKRAKAALERAQPPLYHAVYMERFDVVRAFQEAS